MIQMSELLKDKVYRGFLEREPRMPSDFYRNKRMQASPPWVVYVQREVEGKWGKREFWKYSKALKFLYRALELGVHDAALNNKRIPSPPPRKFVRIRGKYVVGSDGVKRQATKPIAWYPKLDGSDEQHEWCQFCRRPTVFKFYAKHKRLTLIDRNVRRCCICGASERIAIPRRNT